LAFLTLYILGVFTKNIQAAGFFSFSFLFDF